MLVFAVKCTSVVSCQTATSRSQHWSSVWQTKAVLFGVVYLRGCSQMFDLLWTSLSSSQMVLNAQLWLQQGWISNVKQCLQDWDSFELVISSKICCAYTRAATSERMELIWVLCSVFVQYAGISCQLWNNIALMCYVWKWTPENKS